MPSHGSPRSVPGVPSHGRGIRKVSHRPCFGSAFIRAINPSLNRRSERNDRYNLPANYDSILKSEIKAPPPPHPHQPTERKFFTGDRRQGRQRRTIEDDSAATATTTTTTANPTTANSTTQISGHHMVTRRRARVSAGDGDAPD